MQFMSSEFDSGSHIRVWVEELTDYPPQKIDEVLRQMEERDEEGMRSPQIEQDDPPLAR